MFYWFVLYTKRQGFSLPMSNIDEFNQVYLQGYYIQEYIKTSSITMLLLCIKNLRILMIYFPAFGVLLDTIRKSKYDIFFFIILFIVFYLGLLFAGNMLFGYQMYEYRNIKESALTQFRMICGDFLYSNMQQANYFIAPLFFITYVLCFFITLLNLFLTIVMKVYDALRQKKGVESMARAKIISRQNLEYLNKWMNLILCRQPDRTSDLPVIGEEEKIIESQKDLESQKILRKKTTTNLSEAEKILKT